MTKPTRSPARLAWHNMHVRCRNPRFRYHHGKGIQVCERWSSFEHFLADMGHPLPGMTLERDDNDKGYGPDNCRWATRREQSANTSRNLLVTLEGKTLCFSEWARVKGIKVSTAQKRKQLGWPMEKVFA